MSSTGRVKMPAVLENLQAITECVTAAASSAGFSARRIGDMELALEEAVTNVFKYANPGNPGEIEVACASGRGKFSIEIRDSGQEFDITKLPDPDRAPFEAFVSQSPNSPRLDEVKRILAATPFKWSYDEDKRQFSTTSRTLVLELAKCGTYAENKRIPSDNKELTTPYLEAVLHGHWVGDGTIIKRSEERRVGK